MGCLMRTERKVLTLNEWAWCLQVIGPLNRGQFIIPDCAKYRGTIWNHDKSLRGRIERFDESYIWEITIGRQGDCRTIASGAGVIQFAIADLLAVMTRLDVNYSIRQCRDVKELMPPLCVKESDNERLEARDSAPAKEGHFK